MFKRICDVWICGYVDTLFGLYGGMLLDRVLFFLASLSGTSKQFLLPSVRVRTCPKQGMVLQAKRR